MNREAVRLVQEQGVPITQVWRDLRDWNVACSEHRA